MYFVKLKEKVLVISDMKLSVHTHANTDAIAKMISVCIKNTFHTSNTINSRKFKNSFDSNAQFDRGLKKLINFDLKFNLVMQLSR